MKFWVEDITTYISPQYLTLTLFHFQASNNNNNNINNDNDNNNIIKFRALEDCLIPGVVDEQVLSPYHGVNTADLTTHNFIDAAFSAET